MRKRTHSQTFPASTSDNPSKRQKTSPLVIDEESNTPEEFMTQQLTNMRNSGGIRVSGTIMSAPVSPQSDNSQLESLSLIASTSFDNQFLLEEKEEEISNLKHQIEVLNASLVAINKTAAEQKEQLDTLKEKYNYSLMNYKNTILVGVQRKLIEDTSSSEAPSINTRGKQEELEKLVRTCMDNIKSLTKNNELTQALENLKTQFNEQKEKFEQQAIALQQLQAEMSTVKRDNRKLKMASVKDKAELQRVDQQFRQTLREIAIENARKLNEGQALVESSRQERELSKQKLEALELQVEKLLAAQDGLTQEKQQLSEKLHQEESKHQQQVKDLQDQLKSKIEEKDKVISELEEKNKSNSQEHELKLQEQGDLIKQLQNETKELESKHSDLLFDSQWKYHAFLNSEKEIQNVRKEYEEKMELLNLEHQKEIERLTNTFSSEASSKGKEYEGKIQSLQEELNVEKKRNEAWGKTFTEQEGAKSELRAQQQVIINNLKRQLEAKQQDDINFDPNAFFLDDPEKEGQATTEQINEVNIQQEEENIIRLQQEKEVEQLRNQLNDANKKIDELEGLTKNAQGDLIKKLDEMQEIENINKELIEKINDLELANQRKLDQLNAQLEAVKSDHAQQLNQLSIEHEQQIQQLHESGIETLEETRREFEIKEAKLKEKHKERINKFRSALSEMLSKEKEKFAAQLNQKADEYAFQLQIVNNKNEDALNKVNLDYEAQLRALDLQHQEMVARLKQEHIEQVGQQTTNYNQQRKNMESEHESAMTSLKEKFSILENENAKLKPYEQKAETLRAKIDAMESERAERLRSLASNHEREINRLYEEHDSAMSAIEESYTDLNAEKLKLIKQHEKETEEFKIQLSAMERKMAEQSHQEMEDLQKTHVELIGQIKNEHEMRLDALRSQQEQESTSLQEQLNQAKAEKLAIADAYMESLAPQEKIKNLNVKIDDVKSIISSIKGLKDSSGHFQEKNISEIKKIWLNGNDQFKEIKNQYKHIKEAFESQRELIENLGSSFFEIVTEKSECLKNLSVKINTYKTEINELYYKIDSDAKGYATPSQRASTHSPSAHFHNKPHRSSGHYNQHDNSVGQKFHRYNQGNR
jgi:hypothetical protein